MTDERGAERPEESSVPLGDYAEAAEYGAAPRPPFGPNPPVAAPAARTPLYRRTGVLIGAGVAAVAVVAAGVGIGLSQSSSSNPAPAAATGQPGHGHHRHYRRPHAVVGTIATVSGDTWTVNNVDGTTTTVTITPQTRFGTRANQETQSQFAVGIQVAIRGRTENGVVTARWVGHPQDLQQRHHGTGTPPTLTPQPPVTTPTHPN